MKLGVAGWKQREGSGSGNNVQLSGGALRWTPCCGCWETPRVQKTAGWICGIEALPLTERSLCSAALPYDLAYSESLGLLNVPTTPNNTAFSRVDFLWEIYGAVGSTLCHGDYLSRPMVWVVIPPGLHLAQLQYTITNGPSAWRLGATALHSHAIPPFLKRSHLCAPDHWLLSLAQKLLSAALPEFSNTHLKTDHSHPITPRNKDLLPLWPGDTDMEITCREGWERSPSAAANWVNISLSVPVTVPKITKRRVRSKEKVIGLCACRDTRGKLN